MTTMVTVTELGNTSLAMHGYDDQSIRELSDNEIDIIHGGFVCGGFCIGAAIVGAVSLLGGGVYIGYKSAHNTAE